MPLIAWAAYLLGLVPLVWLAGRASAGRTVDPSAWWLGLAFAVSFLADSASRVLPASDRFTVSLLYPLTQAGLVGLVFLTRRDALVLILSLSLVGLCAVGWHDPGQPDILLHTACWGAAAGIVADRWALGQVRTALLVYFALGWVCWIGYTMWPGWTSWGLYQTSRLAGILLFCVAVTQGPRLSVSRQLSGSRSNSG